MTKTQLINAVAAEMENTTKTHVRAFLEAVTTVAGKTLKKEGKFVLPGVVKFVLVKVPPKAARTARNPATGAAMTVPAKPASKKLKARFLKAIKVDTGVIIPESKPAVAKKASKKAAKE
jgi:DNA-binding protein HU-beta